MFVGKSALKKNFEMAIRPFTNEESSGELKGSGSLAGKVGITEINRLLKEIVGTEIERKQELMSLFNNGKNNDNKCTPCVLIPMILMDKNAIVAKPKVITI